MQYYKDITLRSGGELETLKRLANGAKELKELVVKEEESTSLEPHEIEAILSMKLKTVI